MGILNLFGDRKKKHSSDTPAKSESFLKEQSEDVRVQSSNKDYLTDNSIGSISNSLSRDSIQEDFSVYDHDKISIKTDRESISNEEITKGDLLLDTYEVISEAISGGMGSVWCVHHNSWNTDLAMKRPKPRFFAEAGPERKEAFVRECESWIGLGLHPNIVSCYYVREVGGIPTIFSQWMDGGDLKDAIAGGKLYQGSEEEVQERILDISIQAARGLKYAHGMQLIHQDIKPANILMTKDYHVGIADFGLAQARSHMQAGNMSDEGLSNTDATVFTPFGGYTPGYCSPEQFDRKNLTRRTDIYSWALSVLEMYLGDRRWSNGNEISATDSKLYSSGKVSVPEKMMSIIRRSLAADPEQRPHDFEGILNELYVLYDELFHHPYPRPEYKQVTESAETLNNKALSFLDLKKYKEAEECWKLAREKHGNHVVSVFNELLYRWHKAEIDDIEVLKRIRNADDGSAVAMLCQLKIQIARADAGAKRCLEILNTDRDIKLGSPEEIELRNLSQICEKFCWEDEKVCAAPENLIIADENGNLGVRVSDTKDEKLVFTDVNGRILESYQGTGEIYDVLFGPGYTKIALLCHATFRYKEAMIYERGGKLLERGESALDIIAQWQKVFSSGVEEPWPCIVSMSEDSADSNKYLTRLWEMREKEMPFSYISDTKSMGEKFGSGDVLFVLRPYGQKLRTLRMSTENEADKAMNLNACLYLDAQRTYIYKRTIPDPQYLPQMILSRISSYEESYLYDQKFTEKMNQAAEKEYSGQYQKALRLIDEAMSITGHFQDSSALDIRRRLMNNLPKIHYDRMLVLNHYLMSDSKKWGYITEEKKDELVSKVLQINRSVIGDYNPTKNWSINPTELNSKYILHHCVIPTQVPDVYIIIGHGIHTYEHPRYGNDLQQSTTWVAVFDNASGIIRASLNPDTLGTKGGLVEFHNRFDPSDPVTASLSNDGKSLVVSCPEKKLYSSLLCVPSEYNGPYLNCIYPAIADNYYVFFGENYIGLAYMTQETGEIVWEDYSPYEKLIGFDRENSIFIVERKKGETIAREILWNYENPTLRSRIVTWENLDYFGPLKYGSTYF